MTEEDNRKDKRDSYIDMNQVKSNNYFTRFEKSETDRE